MNTLHQLPIWLLFLAFAIPLSLIAWSARAASQSLSKQPMGEPRTISEGPALYHEDGTFTQSVTVEMPTQRSVVITQYFGPIAISAHGRTWAANAMLFGLFLVLLGMIGLFRFPSTFGPQGVSDIIEASEAEEP